MYGQIASPSNEVRNSELPIINNDDNTICLVEDGEVVEVEFD